MTQFQVQKLAAAGTEAHNGLDSWSSNEGIFKSRRSLEMSHANSFAGSRQSSKETWTLMTLPFEVRQMILQNLLPNVPYVGRSGFRSHERTKMWKLESTSEGQGMQSLKHKLVLRKDGEPCSPNIACANKQLAEECEMITYNRTFWFSIDQQHVEGCFLHCELVNGTKDDRNTTARFIFPYHKAKKLVLEIFAHTSMPFRVQDHWIDDSDQRDRYYAIETVRAGVIEFCKLLSGTAKGLRNLEVLLMEADMSIHNARNTPTICGWAFAVPYITIFNYFDSWEDRLQDLEAILQPFKILRNIGHVRFDIVGLKLPREALSIMEACAHMMTKKQDYVVEDEDVYFKLCLIEQWRRLGVTEGENQ